MSSRQPFRNIKQSRRNNGRGTKEKTLTDNLRVLVKPTATPHKYVDENSTDGRPPLSPFRVLTSHSNGPNASSPTHSRNKETQDERRMKLHESEISIFQQLCLDKHDENAAIEILLDCTVENAIPELSSSESTDHGSRRKKSGSVEGKRKFFDRIFKSNRKSQNQSVSPTDFLSSSKESNFSLSHSSDEPSLPTPPSSIPRTRITVENTSFNPQASKVEWTSPSERSRVETKVPKTRSLLDVETKIQKSKSPLDAETKVQKTRSFLDAETKVQKTMSFLDVETKGGDTISNISSISGTMTSSLFTPVNLNRHESLGFESIRDIRKCLIEMERQLGQATNKGQRVSRDKVMRALFTVADSLEDDDETQLQTSMETKTEEVTKPVARSEPPKQDRIDEEDEELESSDDEDYTLDSGTLFDEEEDDDHSGTNDSPLNIVSSVGEFFGVDKNGQHAVEEVLDDLLWTEFVSSRQQNTKKKKGNSARKRSSTPSQKNRKSSVQVKEDKLTENKKPNERKDRPWWRNNRSKEEESEEESEEEEDEYSTSSSEDEFKNYLPTSITVKRRYKKPPKIEDAFTRSFTTPHSKMKLVDTESRLGYEMTPRKSSEL
eukprot:CAMPEP_0116113284 /NCGR_PEP_ID=MMETSP0327-20121206/19421_1 /TAXON_ID=44447 /ORGANISM="Pseudo-nitzschia delicatissima, Strain B596" /LENGTH=604 /DNA_ID=CAMNT_0003606621 /DNA_START=1391 /DNA_END=3205 /DNA_ORIENTATION=+